MYSRRITYLLLIIALRFVGACSSQFSPSSESTSPANLASPTSNPPIVLSTPGSVECGALVLLAKLSLEGQRSMDHPPTVTLDVLNQESNSYGPFLDPHVSYEIKIRNPNANSNVQLDPNLSGSLNPDGLTVPGASGASSLPPSAVGTNLYYVQVEFKTDIVLNSTVVNGRAVRNYDCEDLYPGLSQKKFSLTGTYQSGGASYGKREENISFHFDQSFSVIIDPFVLAALPSLSGARLPSSDAFPPF